MKSESFKSHMSSRKVQRVDLSQVRNVRNQLLHIFCLTKCRVLPKSLVTFAPLIFSQSVLLLLAHLVRIHLNRCRQLITLLSTSVSSTSLHLFSGHKSTVFIIHSTPRSQDRMRCCRSATKVREGRMLPLQKGQVSSTALN